MLAANANRLTFALRYASAILSAVSLFFSSIARICADAAA